MVGKPETAMRLESPKGPKMAGRPNSAGPDTSTIEPEAVGGSEAGMLTGLLNNYGTGQRSGTCS
jgi:hypothetical protein